MANEKNKKTTAAEAPASGGAAAFDISAYLPQGMKADNMVETGKLSPVIDPKMALAEGLVIAGWLDRGLKLPKGQLDFDPRMLLIRELTAATKGVRGKRGVSRETVDVDAGGEVLLPITGNISTNKELIRALTDREHRYFVVARVVGQLPTTKGNDMWVWDIQINFQEKRVREGIYSLSVGDDPIGFLASGETYDSETGEVVERRQPAAQAS